MNTHHPGLALKLRALELEDLDFIYSIENDEALWDVGINNVPYSKFSLTNYIMGSANDIYADRQVRLMMENLQGDPVGILDITNFDPKHLRAEIGIVVAEQERHKGYALEAINQAIVYAREVLHLHQLYALVNKDNFISVQLFKTAGFEEGGILKQWLFLDKKYHDALLMQFFL